MNVQDLKTYLLDNSFVEQVLNEIKCHSIINHGDYISCGNHNGDNKHAIVLYLNDNLTVINYTRQMSKNKCVTDIFDLICYNQQCTFPEALKFVCNLFGLDYYSQPDDIPQSLQILQMLKAMELNSGMEDNEPLNPIPEKVLSYYLPYGNIMFEDDGISLNTQREWEIGFDTMTNSITIPLRDELGSLIAVKARRFKYTSDTPIDKRRFNDILDDGESKYWFCERGAKSQILFGLYKNINLIQQQGVCYVGESEKFCMQLYDMGYYGVSTGGSKLSKRQIEMLTRLGVKIVFCFDKDVTEDDLKNIANNFLDGVPIYAIIDNNNILNDKESPSDDITKWEILIQNNIQQIK